MQTFYLTDPGKIRSHNEDSVIIIENENGEKLLAVADGMGGHKAGEVASSIAINLLSESFVKMSSLGDKESAKNWIKNVTDEINKQIFKYTYENPDSKGMGTTLVMAIYTKEYLLFGNVGDSSGFVIKNNKLYKVTVDHTLVNLLVSTGELTPEEARFHPRKNVLMKALGANDPAEVDIFDVDPAIDAIMLCSDGLTNMLSFEQIERVINSDLDVTETVVRLIRKSNSRGGTDNISIAYLKKESGDF